MLDDMNEVPPLPTSVGNTVSSILQINEYPPAKRRGGEVFLVQSAKQDDWKCDQYIWINDSKSTPKCSENGVKLIKSYFKIRLPGFEAKKFRKRLRYSNTFKRVGYWLEHQLNLVLVHYMGEEKMYGPMTHGDSKHDTEFIRTMPSVIDQIREKEGASHKVYKNIICSNIVDGSHQAVANPINTKQVENIQLKKREKQALSKEDIYNLVLLSYQLDGFVSEVLVYLDLLAVVALPEIIDLFKDLIEIKSDDAVYLVYDTIFNLDDCYVSPLVFKHVLFEETPLIPLAFLIHERNHANWHEILFNFLKSKIPKLDKKKIPFVLDQEPGLKETIKNTFPNCPIMFCWNHLKEDFKFWLKGRVESDNIKILISHLVKMLRTESEEEFTALRSSLTTKWPHVVVEHFDKTIVPAIMYHSGKWLIEKYPCMFDPYSGITNNVSESIRGGFRGGRAPPLKFAKHMLYNVN
jgi:hypothetical protein